MITGIITNKTERMCELTPFDTKKKPMMLYPSPNAEMNSIVLAFSTDFTEKRGVVIRVLGKQGDPSAEKEGMQWVVAPVRWSTSLLSPFETPSYRGYGILNVPTINIEQFERPDIDMCMSVWIEDNKYKVAITIADVSAWVDRNKWVCNKASIIGYTLCDTKIINSMLPTDLVEMCALAPGTTRRGYAFIFTWDGVSVSDKVFRKVAIYNKESYTYDSVLNSNFPMGVLKSLCSSIAERDIMEPVDIVNVITQYYDKCAKQELLRRGRVLESGTFCRPLRRWTDIVNQGFMNGLFISDAV